MSSLGFTSVGTAPKVVDCHVVALYEPDTGNIRHLHSVTVFEGARPVSEQEALRRALENASKAGHKTEHLKVATSKNYEHGAHPHRIDVDTGSFIPLPEPSRFSKNGILGRN